MAYWWLEFNRQRSACVSAPTQEEAKEIALKTPPYVGDRVTRIDVLPYPAGPTLNDMGGMPTFCSTPTQCRGRGACPKSYACSN